LVKKKIIIRHSGGKGRSSLYQFSIVKETEMKKDSVPQTHKGNKVIDISEYVYPSGVTETLPFEDFWKMYPRKVGKGHARLAFKKACEKEDPIKILVALREFVQVMEGKEKQFIPHPTTWLNGERWDDEIEDVSPNEGTNTDRLKNILQWKPEAIENKK